MRSRLGLLLVSLAACGQVSSNPIDARGSGDSGSPDAPTFSIVVMKTGDGTGTVTSSPAGIDCGTTCMASFSATSTVTLTATAATGLFTGWSGGGCTGTDPCTVTVNANTTVTANFAMRYMPDSLTATCTNGTAAVACPGPIAGQDGNYLLHTPVYTADTDTVTDAVTALVWQRNPPTTNITYAAAAAYCDGLALAGQTDWRLPTAFELTTIADAGRVGPPYPTVQFPGIPQNSFYWTSTLYAGGGANHLGMNTNYPVLYSRPDADTSEIVRCVRGAAFAGSLSTSGGSVMDSRTGLQWQSTTQTAQTWANALAYCEALTLDNATDWRLPNTKELLSIVDFTLNNPAISTMFAQRPGGVFWTSTPVPNVPTSAYAIDFTSGTTFNIDTPMTMAEQIRCVR